MTSKSKEKRKKPNFTWVGPVIKSFFKVQTNNMVQNLHPFTAIKKTNFSSAWVVMRTFSLTLVTQTVKEHMLNPMAALWLTPIGHVRYIDILTWLRGLQDKLLNLALFSLYPSLFWELRDKRNLKNLQFWPESIGAMLEYWYIERGLLGRQRTSWPIAWNQRLHNSTGADGKCCSTIFMW